MRNLSMDSKFNNFVAVSFAVAVIILVVIGFVDYRSTEGLIRTADRVAHTREVLQNLDYLLFELSDADAGQRGYVITGNEGFLQPYQLAISQVDRVARHLHRLTSDNAYQQERLARLDTLINSKLDAVRQTVDLRATNGFTAAQSEVASQHGKNLMDEIRKTVGEMKIEEENLLTQRTGYTNASAATAIRLTVFGTGISLLLLFLSFYLLRREINQRQRAQLEISTLNQHLKEHAARLEAANKELEGFSYSVSHDLRAPIRHISGFVDLLGKQETVMREAKNARYLKFIGDSARQMGTLVDDLLSFSRMSRTEIHLGTVSLAHLVKEARDELALSVADRSVIWRFSPDLPEVQADAAMLHLVFVNLLSNAIKYTGTRSEASIEVQYSSTRDEHIISVHDNGVGFDMQYVDKLFGVFKRLHHAEEFEGTGIGLANVRSIINRHGGRTWAEGRLDRGAAFFFSLPKVRPHPVKQP